MALDQQRLMDFLATVETQLDEGITLVAAGGTALVLLDVKRSTIDVDFTGPQSSIRTFREALESIPHGFDVDTWDGGYVFTTRLPGDYLDRADSPQAAGRLERIDLRTLHPVDLVVTKIGRLDERDEEDIRNAVQAFDLGSQEIRDRAQQVELVANEEVFTHNLKVALEKIDKDWRGDPA